MHIRPGRLTAFFFVKVLMSSPCDMAICVCMAALSAFKVLYMAWSWDIWSVKVTNQRNTYDDRASFSSLAHLRKAEDTYTLQLATKVLLPCE
jgi:hypothetical protein